MTLPAHVPVLRERVLALIGPAVAVPDAVILDATVGLGGHAEALLTEFPAVRLVGLDRDQTALELAGERLAPFAERVTLVHAIYDGIPDVLARLGLHRVRGILFDLGVSSMQLDRAERGFAYAEDVQLDMRMDQTIGIKAADVLNTYPADQLARVLHDYGEERFARRIADAVVRERRKAPFTTSARLVELIRAVIPAPARRAGGNPAKRTFQALRIEVNGELAALERALPRAIDALAVAGRIVVLSYHSLEDRIVKRVFAAAAASSAPPDLPVVPTPDEPVLRLLTRGAETADEHEIAMNPRARPVRLRAAERRREAA